MFDAALIQRTERFLSDARARHLKVSCAESCTGGLITGLLTEVAGSSDVVDRGFVTYSNSAKTAMLGVSDALLMQYGAVSEEVARAMAEGAVAHSLSDVSVAVTGIAGPGGGTPGKPVGLVHIATARRNGPTLHLDYRFGDIARSNVRFATVREAISMLASAIS